MEGPQHYFQPRSYLHFTGVERARSVSETRPTKLGHFRDGERGNDRGYQVDGAVVEDGRAADPLHLATGPLDDAPRASVEARELERGAEERVDDAADEPAQPADEDDGPLAGGGGEPLVVDAQDEDDVVGDADGDSAEEGEHEAAERDAAVCALGHQPSGRYEAARRRFDYGSELGRPRVAVHASNCTWLDYQFTIKLSSTIH